jgi:hypothetical protein
MADNASRRGAVDMGTPLMILAFAVIVGFLYWLSGQAAAERALDIVEDTATVDNSFASVETVSGVDLQADATPYVGRQIRLSTFHVASLLGSQGFWIDLPNQNPFLVSMSADVMAEGIAVAPGSTATIVGVIHAMGDSTLTAWTEAGTIGEGERIVAEFATHYIEAANVTITGGDGSGASGSGASDN